MSAKSPHPLAKNAGRAGHPFLGVVKACPAPVIETILRRFDIVSGTSRNRFVDSKA